MTSSASEPARSDSAHVWDLLVVGGGTAGIVASHSAATIGARVLLVERDRTGGDCLWTGCVPSKSLLAAAGCAAMPRRAARLGVDLGAPTVDFPAVMRHVRSAISTIEPQDSPQALREVGVEVWQGDLTFTGPDTAEVAGRSVRFLQAVVCTGSSPALPEVEGMDEVAPLTSDDVWDLESLPERLTVLGGGTIGCELGQAFARLGAKVTVVETAPRVLVDEDAEASAVVAAALREDEVDVRTGVSATKARAAAGGGGHLELSDGSTVAFDRLLVAVGRTPGTAGLGLGQVGVELDDSGHVRVDDHLRTAVPTIWAAGDVTPRPKLTHVAGVDGSVAALNALLGLRRTVDQTVPRVTFTSPEVAAVGVSVAAAQQDRRLRVVVKRHRHVDRAIAEGETAGFAKLVVDRRGRLQGAVVVGPRAGETLGELTLAVRQRLTVSDLTGTMHAYPTFNDGPWNAAIDHYRGSLQSPMVGRALRVVSGLRRRWVQRR